MQTNKKSHISALVNEYAIPPMKDMLILGKNAPIGCIAMRKSIELLVKAPFEHIEIDDDVISDILVRQLLLKRVSTSSLTEFVLSNIKPIMSPEEVLHAELDIKVYFSEGI